MQRITGKTSAGLSAVKKGVTPLINSVGKLLRIDKEKAEVLFNFLPQSSMPTSLPTPVKWMDSRMGTGGEKSLSL